MTGTTIQKHINVKILKGPYFQFYLPSLLVSTISLDNNISDQKYHGQLPVQFEIIITEKGKDYFGVKKEKCFSVNLRRHLYDRYCDK